MYYLIIYALNFEHRQTSSKIVKHRLHVGTQDTDNIICSTHPRRGRLRGRRGAPALGAARSGAAPWRLSAGRRHARAINTSHVTLQPLSRRTCTPSPAIRLLFTVLSNRENGMGHAVTANFQQIAIFYCFGRFIQILNSMRLISSVVDRRCLDVQSSHLYH